MVLFFELLIWEQCFFQDSNAHSLQAPPRGLDGLGDGDGVEEVAQWGAGARLQPRQEQVQVHDEHCWQAGLWSTRLKVNFLVLERFSDHFFQGWNTSRCHGGQKQGPSCSQPGATYYRWAKRFIEICKVLLNWIRACKHSRNRPGSLEWSNK